MLMPRKFRRPMAVAVVGMLRSMWGCARSAETRSPKAAINQEPQQAAIHYVKVVQQELPDTLDLAAKVQPDPTKVFRIFPPASGRVVAIEVKPGDYVARGQPVAMLSSSDVASAQSDFA